MRKWILTTAKAAGLLLIGTALGPVAIAAVGAVIEAYRAHNEISYSGDEAWLLLEEAEDFEEERSRGEFKYISPVPPMDGKECGYEPKQLFPPDTDQFSSAIDERRFTDYIGYDILDRWRHETRDEEWLMAKSIELDAKVGQFQLGFLRRCIAYTLFQGVCYDRAMNLIADVTENIQRFDHNRKPHPYLGFGIEDEIVCTYVEGVARRRNLPSADGD